MTSGAPTASVSLRGAGLDQKGPVTMRDADRQGGSAADAHHLEQARGQSDGMRVLSYLLAGVLLYGGLGWLGDRLLGTQWLLPVGLVLGAGLGIYTVIRRFAVTADEAVPTSHPEVTREKERR